MTLEVSEEELDTLYEELEISLDSLKACILEATEQGGSVYAQNGVYTQAILEGLRYKIGHQLGYL